jgi:DNA polymerase III alpha subunit (gram-positive type)
VDINKSQPTISCTKEGVLLGFDSVVGIGEKQIQTIVQNQPYKDFVDFKRRCKVPATQKEKLLKLGTFRNLHFTSLDAQADLFGASEAVQENGFDYRSPSEDFVREFCPLASGNTAHRFWVKWIGQKIKGKLWPICQLDDISKKTEVMIAGFTDPRTRFHLKNKMEEAAVRGQDFNAKVGEEDLEKEDYSFLNFDLEDETDSVIVRVSYKAYPKLKKMLWEIKPSDAIGVRGMMTGVMRMVFASQVVNLTLLREKIERKETLTKYEREFIEGSRRK